MNEIDKWEIENIEKLYKSIIVKEPLLSISIFIFFHEVAKLRRLKQAHSVYPGQIKDSTFPSKVKVEHIRPCVFPAKSYGIGHPRDKKRTERIAEFDDCEKWNNCYGKCAFKNEYNLAGYYIGDFKNGKFDGRGTSMFRDGYVYHGDFKNGYKNGFGVSFLKDEEEDKYIKRIGIWKNNELVEPKNLK